MKKFFSKEMKGLLIAGVSILTASAIFVISPLCVWADSKGTVNTTNVNIRTSADSSSDAVGSATTGDSITIKEEVSGADGKTWYKITTALGKEGYIRSDFVTKSDAADGEQKPAETANVTATDAKVAYVAGTSKVNVRKNASTTSDVVASAQAKSQITIIGEATSTDGYKWYQIEFDGNGQKMKGYIRSDLVTFTAPASEPAETEITGTLGEETPAEETPAEEAPEEGEEATEAPAEETPVEETAADTTAASASSITIIQPTSEPEVIPAGFKEVEVKISEQTMRAWANGNYYILYGYENDSEPQWYVYDYKNGHYIECTGLFTPTQQETGLFGGSKIGTIIMFVLIGLVIILAIIVIILLFKLSNNDSDEYYDDYEDDDYGYEKKSSKKESKSKKSKKKSKYDDDDDDYFDYDDDDDDDFFEEPVKKTVRANKSVAAQPKNTISQERVSTVTPQSSNFSAKAVPNSNPYVQQQVNNSQYVSSNDYVNNAQYVNNQYYDNNVNAFVDNNANYANNMNVYDNQQIEPQQSVQLNPVISEQPLQPKKPQVSYVPPRKSDVEYEDDDYEDDDYEEESKSKSKSSKKDKKNKAKKGGLGKKLLNYFTVEVDDEDDDYDEYYDEYDDEDDDDDMDFIDV